MTKTCSPIKYIDYNNKKPHIIIINTFGSQYIDPHKTNINYYETPMTKGCSNELKKYYRKTNLRVAALVYVKVFSNAVRMWTLGSHICMLSVSIGYFKNALQ